MAEGFLAADAILNILLNVSDGLVVYPKVVRSPRHGRAALHGQREHHDEAPSRRAATVRSCTSACASTPWPPPPCVKQEGKPNDMIARVEADPAFGLSREEIEAELSPEAFTGRSARAGGPNTCVTYIQPVLDANAEDVGQHVELNV